MAGADFISGTEGGFFRSQSISLSTSFLVYKWSWWPTCKLCVYILGPFIKPPNLHLAFVIEMRLTQEKKNVEKLKKETFRFDWKVLAEERLKSMYAVKKKGRFRHNFGDNLADKMVKFAGLQPGVLDCGATRCTEAYTTCMLSRPTGGDSS